MGTLTRWGRHWWDWPPRDIAAMAENLQVAFSTTVVGLFVGGIGFAVQQEDANAGAAASGSASPAN